ncbi:MAG: anti-sigma factor [Parasphingorhabdus sp.]|nr:anti-sigma factor [Parasphingorhabdus sp.]
MANEPLSPDREMRAAELALGVLEGDALAAALREQLADCDFADAVAAWQARLAPMLEGFAPVTPDEALRAKILAALNDDESAVVQMIAPAGPGGWRWAALVSGALAASLALFIVLRPLPTPVAITAAPQIQLVAQLSGDSKELSIAARWSPETGELRIKTTGIETGEKAAELWLVPEDGKPRSLGLIPAAGTTQLSLSSELRQLVAEGALLAVTIEDPATAPHPAPTTPVLASGKIIAI